MKIFVVYGRSHNYDNPEDCTPPLKSFTTQEKAEGFIQELSESDEDDNELTYYFEQVDLDCDIIVIDDLSNP
jgi:hypothetical protein